MTRYRGNEEQGDCGAHHSGEALVRTPWAHCTDHDEDNNQERYTNRYRHHGALCECAVAHMILFYMCADKAQETFLPCTRSNLDGRARCPVYDCVLGYHGTCS